MGFVEGLQCRECGRKYDVSPVYVCEFCFGPLEVMYRYDEIKERLTVEEIMRRPKTMWRYKELLPVDHEAELLRLGKGNGDHPILEG